MESVKTYSPKAIAQKHGVYIDVIMRQLEMGIKVEQEHTKNPEMAREIALDHLLELPDYYTRLQKMEESDIQDILHRSGIQVEADESRRKLDKFENLITDIALRLIDEDDDMDAASAGMDILDAINANIMTESLRRNAGTWYDPLKRALDILEDELPEDILAKVRDKLDAYANDYIRNKSEDDEEDEEDCDCEETSVTEMAEEMTELILRVDEQGLKQYGAILELMEQITPMRMRFTEWSDDEAEMRKRAGLNEQCQCELMDDHGMDSLSNDTLAQVIPELRGIALHYVQDKASQQRLQEIAEQLTALKTQLGSSL
ncbi:MAG: DUF5661 family protein [Candidatus Thorarchaeota archaeon]